VHIANEERLLAGVSTAERRVLDDVLRKLLEALENGSGPPRKEPSSPTRGVK
jgi:hypothetical protein